ncbi:MULTISPECIES: protein translocase subunit SecD [unclassified Herbaspirillum]|uniref:protein translocase subunit SecD n=1 Tax=unclassified Herbaspirillum TaxID=2624150 RepID=UPI000E2F1FA6|nr:MULTISPECIES: protein translocase subunit SecD [unclassified Herbaspirillum]RFB69484.1 protein translocase subunit SecD [Herbaspirillum sp. 3R-3a1]TFI07461.1 protein translocase subunit SecD [Herbaspirillum sp. 3R11]TFI12235.1 protein translocase subunit SecD [Herbaspirillum sp. 3R-11]TFI19602.1 protein translocase subunit SecD [Herbaspirillum sp. 3C11]
MNRYPLWKYVLIVIALLFGTLYTLPNFFGESPAVQISSAKSTIKVDSAVAERVQQILQQGSLAPESVAFDNSSAPSVRARFANTDTQFKAKALLEKGLNTDPADPTYIVAFNLLPNTPQWLQSLHAFPMYLGLDLRGGVHFLMQVDVKAVLNKRLQGLQSSVRSVLRDKNIRHNGINRNGDRIEILFRDADTRDKAKSALAADVSELALADSGSGDDLKVTATLRPEALKQTQEDGVKQNISTLSKRVNELGVAEPIIQRQGADRIVVQLPGVQDVSRAKDIIGRTATLEVRMVDDSVARGTEETAAVPFGSELFKIGKGAPVVLYKEPVLTGDYISNASASFDENHQPSVSIDLNGDGGRKMRDATREKVGKAMAIVLFEKGKGEVLTVATIRSELGSRFQITGMGSAESSSDLALLLRAGSLAAPMDIIEERTIGPQLGAENIRKGFDATLYGFAAMAIFMIVYYQLFGLFSALALSVNVLLLVAVLSTLQATLTLPGIAAIALALGMAIDSNVLINERIREELRNGNSPQAAISIGFDRAWATILDSNVTTLIAGLALLIFGSGAIRGFAVVHCLGILTSMFSAVFFSRGLANLWYGRKKKLTSLAIGQIWKPQGDTVSKTDSKAVDAK